MSSANTDEYNLTGAVSGGHIHEDVMEEIWNIDPIDVPFQDMCRRGTSDNAYKEWVKDSLAAASITNALVDGADAGSNSNTVGTRLGNYHQIMGKVVKVSDRARNSRSIGRSDELVYGLMKAQKELKRDMEATLTLFGQAAVYGNPSTPAASYLASLGAWIMTNSYRGTDGADAVLSGTTGGYIDTAATEGDGRALSEATLRQAIRAAYDAGGNPTKLMSTPQMIETITNYLFTSSARIAALQSNVAQGTEGATAVGAVNVYVTNFGTLELVPNRFIQVYDSNDATPVDVTPVYGLDPDYWEISYLQGIETKPLARTGTAENRQMTVDVTLCALAEESSFGIFDILAGTAMTA